MMMKGSLLLVFGIILLNCIINECRIIQCYSCSDCANSVLKDVNIIQTTNDKDQCIKTTILTGTNRDSDKQVNRGASSQCQPYSSEQISIYCCQSDFCNA
ncbi:unnamed protein product [Rotaria sp. Silwood1]|nr:unnamed protein product [Rotaria sp. Silwood1]CAF1521163.1 unnamed protein product [Rotaria sp. Silwood1]CAF1522885.1 unnamed protein product [Rotaria sp. Silwood1]CAF4684505.1 unnamed protein product [Rotaria sp. Silwood1]